MGPSKRNKTHILFIYHVWKKQIVIDLDWQMFLFSSPIKIDLWCDFFLSLSLSQCHLQNHFLPCVLQTLMVYNGDLQPFTPHGSHKLITKILWHTKKYIFSWSDKSIGIVLIHSPLTDMVTLIDFLLDNLREKRSVLLAK